MRVLTRANVPRALDCYARPMLPSPSRSRSESRPHTVPVDPLLGLAISRRDRMILALARRHAGTSRELGEVLRALREATAEIIPAGRVYLLGERRGAPIAGSILSGVGIAMGDHGVEIVGVVEGRVRSLGGLWT